LARLEYAIEHLDSLGTIRAVAREAAAARFDWSVVTARLEKIYLDAIAKIHTA
jgi:hypothetical protein